MCLRKWTYMRLDGSSTISERRNMVADLLTSSLDLIFWFFSCPREQEDLELISLPLIRLVAIDQVRSIVVFVRLNN